MAQQTALAAYGTPGMVHVFVSKALPSGPNLACIVNITYLNPLHEFEYPPALVLPIPDAIDLDAANPEHDFEYPDRIIMVECR